MKNKFKIIILFSIFYFLFSIATVEAAQLNLISQSQEIGVGSQFQVDLMLDAKGDDINAVEGNIVFSPVILELKEIKDSNSIINFWIEKPHEKQETGEIVFSGMIPSGFKEVLSPYYKGGRQGKIFSLVFLAKKEGASAIQIKNAQVLLNDGAGTEAPLSISNLNISVSENAPIIDILPSGQDLDPPELFTPEISRVPSLFDGKWFLVFTAQDKVSGIDYYEIRETRNRKEAASGWILAESPYLLKDQTRSSYVFVKAIDHAGNERIVVVDRLKFWYEKPLVDIIIGAIILVVLLLVVRWLWRWLHTKKHEY